MGAILKWSLILVGVVTLLSIVVVLAFEPGSQVGGIAFVVVATILNVACVFFALNESAATNGYGKQLLNGILLGVLAGAMIFFTSYVLNSFVFTGHMAAVKEIAIDQLTDMDVPEDQERIQLAIIEKSELVGALFGLIGTLVTSTVAGAIVAAFKRKQ